MRAWTACSPPRHAEPSAVRHEVNRHGDRRAELATCAGLAQEQQFSMRLSSQPALCRHPEGAEHKPRRHAGCVGRQEGLGACGLLPPQQQHRHAQPYSRAAPLCFLQAKDSAGQGAVTAAHWSSFTVNERQCSRCCCSLAARQSYQSSRLTLTVVQGAGWCQCEQPGAPRATASSAAA